RLRRPERWHQASERRDLAGQLYGLRSRILRPGDLQTRTDRKPLRTKSVTYVSGINRNPCGRNGPTKYGALGAIRTPDPQIRSLMLYPAELRARRRCLSAK